MLLIQDAENEAVVSLHHRPAAQTASSDPSPHSFPPLGGSEWAAGKNNTASVRTDFNRLTGWMCDWLLIYVGSSTHSWEVSYNIAPHLPAKPQVVIKFKKQVLFTKTYCSVKPDVNTHRVPAFFSEKMRTRKSASWWGWKVVGTSRYFPGGRVKRSDTSLMLM